MFLWFSPSFSGWLDVPVLADVRIEERSSLIWTDSCLETVCGTWGYKAWSKSHQNNEELMRCFSTYLHSQALGNKAQDYWVVLLFSIYYSKQSWRDINTIILRRRIQKPFICAWKIWHLMTWNVLAWSRTYFITHHHPPSTAGLWEVLMHRSSQGPAGHWGFCAASSCLLKVCSFGLASVDSKKHNQLWLCTE